MRLILLDHGCTYRASKANLGWAENRMVSHVTRHWFKRATARLRINSQFQNGKDVVAWSLRQNEWPANSEEGHSQSLVSVSTGLNCGISSASKMTSNGLLANLAMLWQLLGQHLYRLKVIQLDLRLILKPSRYYAYQFYSPRAAMIPNRAMCGVNSLILPLQNIKQPN